MPQEEKHILAYLKGELPAEEALALEERSRRDPEFHETVEDLRLMLDLARESHAQRVQEEVAAARSRYESDSAPAAPAAPKRRPWLKMLLAAASIALLCVVVYQLRPPWNERTANGHLAQLWFAGAVQGSSGTDMPPGIAEYVKEEYDKAIPIFNERLKDPGLSPLQRDSTRLLLGSSYMLDDQFDKAIPVLRDAEEAGTLPCPPCDIAWQMGLALLHEGAVAEAQARFKMVEANATSDALKAKARELLAEIAAH